MARGVDPSKTFDGNPCSRCGETLRWRNGHGCVACKRRYIRSRRDYYREYRRAEYDRNPLSYYSTLLRNRRRDALKRIAARNERRKNLDV